MIYRARYILDEHLRALDNAALRVRDGRIVEIGPAASVTGNDVLDLGDAVLMPGLVNAHTHLELGFAAGRVPPTPDFVHWLECLLAEIRAATQPAIESAVRCGLYAALKSGTTLIGDITRDPHTVRSIIAATSDRPRVVSFGEVIALGTLLPEADARIIAALETRHAGNDLHIGISPHAPYTVEETVLKACIQHANAMGKRVCMHAAEAREEERFMESGDGPLRDYFLRLGLWPTNTKTPGCRPLEYLDRSGALRSTTLLAHCNYVTEAEIDRLRETGTSVVYCPRTHRAFGHDPHPFMRMLERGVNVCLGTDSLASNPDLSILEEMRFLRREHPDLPAATILKMGASAGVKALGAAKDSGSLRSGARADFTAIPLDPGDNTDPLECLLREKTAPRMTVVGGRLVLFE